MKPKNVITELKGIGREVISGILVKVVSVFLSILLIPKIASGENYYLILTYSIGLLNMSKIFDGALPYLQRICYARGYGVTLRSEVEFSLLVYFAHFLIFFVITDNLTLALSLAAFGKLYAVANFKLNVSRRSYFFYLQHTIALAVCLFIPRSLFEAPDILYISVSTAVILIGLLTERDITASQIERKPLLTLWTSNVSMNAITMLVFFCYAEFAAVMLYGTIPSKDYAIINSVTKSILVIVGAASVISTPLWNYGNQNIGVLDRLSVAPKLYLPIFFLGVLNYFILPGLFPKMGTFFGLDPKLLSLILVIAAASVGNLFISQILVRIELSKQLLILSIFELGIMILMFMTYSSTEVYILIWTILVSIKYCSGIYILRMRNG